MDIIVFGATSFVGRILCHYLWQRYGGGDLEWAIAGRSEEKLQQLRQSLGADESTLPHFLADAEDEESLRSLCRRTRVIVSSVGPYALYGEPLVRVCAETGTDYCDLAGEVHWIRRMISRYEQAANASGARIVHSCGFDSIPSDLGVYFIQQQAKALFNEYCTEVRMRVKKMQGGASGGTIESMINVAREASRDPALRRELANPYSLCPEGHGLTARQRSVGLAWDKENDSWMAPFIMAGINTRIVHRSHALAGEIYGPDFRYEEAMLTGDGRQGAKRARRLGVGLKLFMFAVSIAPLRALVRRFLPKPGEGPSPEEQESGYFDLLFNGRTEDGERIRVTVHGDRDPGYGCTARMLGETAVCLARDIPGDEISGGFWTPATLAPEKLLHRLEKNAGMRFTRIEPSATTT